MNPVEVTVLVKDDDGTRVLICSTLVEQDLEQIEELLEELAI